MKALRNKPGYRNSAGTHYGVYGSNAYASGAGKLYKKNDDYGHGVYYSSFYQDDKSNHFSSAPPLLSPLSGTAINIGIGAYGDLFGADIHGRIYGLYTEGGVYAAYSNGDVYTKGLDIQLQRNNQNEEKLAALYNMVSTDVKVYAAGKGKLINGVCVINFDEKFKNVVSPNEQVMITVTPNGNSNGVYIAEIYRNTGFKVVENNNGSSNVEFTYIAVGTRTGYENPTLPDEVISSDYNEKIATGLNDDSNIGEDGRGLYYQDGKLIVGKHPKTLGESGDKKKTDQQIKDEQKENEANENRKKMNAESEANYKKYIEEKKNITKQKYLQSTSDKK